MFKMLVYEKDCTELFSVLKNTVLKNLEGLYESMGRLFGGRALSESTANSKCVEECWFLTVLDCF